MSNQNNKDNMETVAMRVCIVSIFGNTILSLIKLLAGVINDNIVLQYYCDRSVMRFILHRMCLAVLL